MLDSFLRFDDFLLDRIFNPIARWVFATIGRSNYWIVRQLCWLTFLANIYDSYHQAIQGQLGNTMLDTLIMPIIVAVFRIAWREDKLAPGTLSPFRASYLYRFLLLIMDIVICGFTTNRVFTTPVMANLFVLIYYFIACDKPKSGLRQANSKLGLQPSA